MPVKLVVLAVLMIGSLVAQAQAQKNTDVPSGPAVWPLIKSPAPTQSSPAPKGSNPAPQSGGDGNVAPNGTDAAGAGGRGGSGKGNDSNPRGK